MSRLAHILSKPSLVAGVEVHLNDVLVTCQVVLLRHRRGKVSIEASFQDLTFEGVLSSIDPWVPVHVVMSGSGVISRTLPLGQNATRLDVIRALVPHGNPDDVLVEFQNSLEGINAALCRKDRWLHIRSNLTGLKALQLHSFGLESNAMLEQVAPRQNGHVKFDGEEVEPGLEGALGAALVLATQPNMASSDLEEMASNRKYRTLITRIGAVGVAILFASAAINLVAHQNLQKKHARLSAEVQTHKALIQEIGMLEAQVESKRSLIEQTGLTSGQRLTAFSDKVGATVSEKIQLQRMSFAPASSKLKPGKPVKFDERNVVAEGSATNADALSEWMGALRTLNEVSGVELKHFEKSGRTPGAFIILIERKG